MPYKFVVYVYLVWWKTKLSLTSAPHRQNVVHLSCSRAYFLMQRWYITWSWPQCGHLIYFPNTKSIFFQEQLISIGWHEILDGNIAPLDWKKYFLHHKRWLPLSSSQVGYRTAQDQSCHFLPHFRPTLMIRFVHNVELTDKKNWSHWIITWRTHLLANKCASFMYRSVFNRLDFYVTFSTSSTIWMNPIIAVHPKWSRKWTDCTRV